MTARHSPLLLVALLTLALPTQAQELTLDPDFDAAPIEGFDYRALDTAVDLKDRPLLVGRSRGYPSTDLSIVRVQPNGVPDQSFGGGEVILEGLAPEQGDRSEGVIARIDHDTSDRVVVVGSYLSEQTSIPFVARYLEDGTPDADIGPDGFHALDPGFSANVTGLAIFERYVFVGLHSPETGACYVAGLTSDGRLDDDFGSGGLFEVATDGACTSRDLLTTGNLLYFLGDTEAGGQRRTVVAAVDLKGVPSDRFGDDGLVVLDGGPRVLEPTTLAAWEGDLVVAGTARPDAASGAGRALFVTRLRPDGTVDGAFADGAGMYVGDPPGEPTSARIGLAVAKGSLVVSTSAQESDFVFTLVATVFGPTGERTELNGPDGFFSDVRTSDRARQYTYASVGTEADSRGRVVVGAWRVLSGSGLNQARINRLVFEPSAVAVSAEGGPGGSASLALAPNPTAGAAWVTLDRPGTVTVLDLLGREVGRVEGVGRVALPTGGLAPGLYVVVAESEAERQTARLSVVR